MTDGRCCRAGKVGLSGAVCSPGYDGRQGEIKGPPSLGAYVVGLVEAFAPSRKWCRRRLRQNPLEYQCRKRWHGRRRWRARPIERLNPAARPAGCGCAAGVDPLARPRWWCGMVAVATLRCQASQINDGGILASAAAMRAAACGRLKREGGAPSRMVTIMARASATKSITVSMSVANCSPISA